jgi:hypothetical protein
MSTKKKFKAEQTVHPAGVAVFPKLDQPYYYDEKVGKSFPDPKAEHSRSDLSIEVAYTEAEAAPLIKQIKDYAVSQGFDLEDVKNWPFKKEKDKDTRQPTGRVRFKWKAYAKTMDGDLNSVPHYDAKLNKLPKGSRITAGSLVRPKGRILAFDVGAQNGMRLLIEAIQIIEKRTTEADASGFDATDGYTYADNAPTEGAGETNYASQPEVAADSKADF